jgi:hypothetical protein
LGVEPRRSDLNVRGRSLLALVQSILTGRHFVPDNGHFTPETC